MLAARGFPGAVAVAFAAASLLACRTASGGAASPAETCVIMGSVRSPADVRIYESDPYARPAGKRLYIGLLNFRERQRIHSRTGRIWYAFKNVDGDTWLEGHEAPCRDGQVVQLP